MEEYDLLAEGKSYYSTVGETYHTNRLKEKINKFFIEELREKEKLMCLDVGCNIGTDMFMLSLGKENRIFFVGTDVALSAASYGSRLAKKRKNGNVYFNVHDANCDFPFKDNVFDIIICSEVIEHIKSPICLIKEFHRMLKINGILIISTPNKNPFLSYVLGVFPFLKRKINQQRKWDFSRMGDIGVDADKWDHEAHISLMSFSEMKVALKKNGFLVENVKGSSFFGGASWLEKHSILLGLLIIIDYFVDKIPLHPMLQMCMIIKAKKTPKLI